jgi:hypothetical protein
VGQGLCDTSAPLQVALAEAASLGAQLSGVTAQGARLSLLTGKSHGTPLLRRLHEKLVAARST